MPATLEKNNAAFRREGGTSCAGLSRFIHVTWRRVTAKGGTHCRGLRR